MKNAAAFNQVYEGIVTGKGTIVKGGTNRGSWPALVKDWANLKKSAETSASQSASQSDSANFFESGMRVIPDMESNVSQQNSLF